MSYFDDHFDASQSGFATIAIHSHQKPDPTTGAVIQPIYQTSTFAQETVLEAGEFDYTRCGNPNMNALEGVLADLEGGVRGFAFSSGLGALTTLTTALFKPGDHIVSCSDVYGGSFGVFDKILRKYDVQTDFVDFRDMAALEAALTDKTKALHVETPTNPNLKLIDIAAVAKLAKANGLLTIVDNTFATPCLQRPFELGADIVWHSTTKYIGGHSDVVGGAIIIKDKRYEEVLFMHQKLIGANPDPFACWLALRGLKTLPIRMNAHQQNAMAVAEFLKTHPAVDQVIYPGLPEHPDHELAKRQMNGFGGMVTLTIKGGPSEVVKVTQALKLFTVAVSLGGVESLVCYPYKMTHGSMPDDFKLKTGILPNMLRLSVGIEDIDDLKRDLKQALDVVVGATV
ncbi:MAG: PLP-dependent transferase [Cyanobacteria bacterium HKST-UBA04]|nr:PLP-dependent transferase [Cyanobacteria bacterium HKST-UBA04]MCA9842264.1 PLP-dependent transferase [Cyanobacteria bacterium HKST-UBA03]